MHRRRLYIDVGTVLWCFGTIVYVVAAILVANWITP